MTQLKNKIILITGGASGIGRIMSRLSLEKNAKVIIWDVNTQNIENTLKDLNPLGTISSYVVDLSNLVQIQEAAKKTKDEHGNIDILINNAGIVVGKYFHEHTAEEIEKTMMINANAPMHVTSSFLSEMIDQNLGHICNIASSASLLANPKMSVYAASKWSVLAWSDSLRLEIKQLNKNIKVTTILPYYINTGMFDGVKSRIPILDAEKTALTIIKSIEKNKKIITIPWWIYRFTRFGQTIMSVNLFDWFAGKVMGIYKTMDDFKGR
ncbi:MAG: SDR family oxidoreductase [Flavobacteriaceae bacterium]|nr:SDR family oxidoreductase [Flavobacteriaceae bacterium]